MQIRKALNRVERLEKEILEVKRSLYSSSEFSRIKSKKRMHSAALNFLKLQDIPDKIKIDSVELVRQERKHAITLDSNVLISDVKENEKNSSDCKDLVATHAQKAKRLGKGHGVSTYPAPIRTRRAGIQNPS